MTTQKPLSKEKILEALKKNKITDLEQFIEALLPNETGGYTVGVAGMVEELTLGLALVKKFRGSVQEFMSSENWDMFANPDEGDFEDMRY